VFAQGLVCFVQTVAISQPLMPAELLAKTKAATGK